MTNKISRKTFMQCSATVTGTTHDFPKLLSDNTI